MRFLGFCLVFAYGCLAGEVALQTRTNFVFKEDGIRISNRFSGARISDCVRLKEGEYRLLIRPENTPINRSPWYAFKVRSRKEQTIKISLRYQNAVHRYHPQTSRDGTVWDRLAKERVQVSPRRTEATLTLEVGRQALWVAGQERIGIREIRAWTRKLKSRGARKRKIGSSLGGQGIQGLQFGSRSSTNLVLIVSRQHPPEVTGTIGLMAFVDRLLRHDELAGSFRQQIGILLVPMMNPDGIQEGHWRHNLAGVDLNRDWKDFRQPETRAVRDWIEDTLQQRSARPLLFLDFHSTHYDVFYTQKDEHPTTPRDFTRNWLQALGDRMPDYRVHRVASHNPDSATSKAWAYKRFGCPAITYEYGDHTDRDLIRRQATIAAEEMMTLLLKHLRP